MLQPVRSAKPHAACLVTRDRQDQLVTLQQRGRRWIADEDFPRLVEARQTALGAEPQAPFAVLVRGHHVVVDQAGTVERIVAKDPDLVTVVAVQSGLSADPHEAFAVLQDVQHRLLRQALLESEPFETQTAWRGPGICPAQQYRCQQHAEQRPCCVPPRLRQTLHSKPSSTPDPCNLPDAALVAKSYQRSRLNVVKCSDQRENMQQCISSHWTKPGRPSTMLLLRGGKPSSPVKHKAVSR